MPDDKNIIHSFNGEDGPVPSIKKVRERLESNFKITDKMEGYDIYRYFSDLGFTIDVHFLYRDGRIFTTRAGYIYFIRLCGYMVSQFSAKDEDGIYIPSREFIITPLSQLKEDDTTWVYPQFIDIPLLIETVSSLPSTEHTVRYQGKDIILDPSLIVLLPTFVDSDIRTPSPKPDLETVEAILEDKKDKKRGRPPKLNSDPSSPESGIPVGDDFEIGALRAVKYFNPNWNITATTKDEWSYWITLRDRLHAIEKFVADGGLDTPGSNISLIPFAERVAKSMVEVGLVKVQENMLLSTLESHVFTDGLPDKIKLSNIANQPAFATYIMQ